MFNTVQCQGKPGIWRFCCWTGLGGKITNLGKIMIWRPMKIKCKPVKVGKWRTNCLCTCFSPVPQPLQGALTPTTSLVSHQPPPPATPFQTGGPNRPPPPVMGHTTPYQAQWSTEGPPCGFWWSEAQRGRTEHRSGGLMVGLGGAGGWQHPQWGYPPAKHEVGAGQHFPGGRGVHRGPYAFCHAPTPPLENDSTHPGVIQARGPDGVLWGA